MSSGVQDSTAASSSDRFVTERSSRWQELEGLLGSARRRPESLGPAGVRRLAALYRAAAADLVVARRRFPDDPAVDRLESLVRGGHGVVYERSERRGNLIEFFASGYWELLWERRRPLLLAVVILVLPAVLMATWALAAPEAVAGVVPPEFLWVTEADTTDQGLGGLGLAGFSAYVFTNNIRVALTAFVAGVTWGGGTALLIGYNGVLFGALTGLAAGAGNLRLLGEATLAHGLLELSCIVVAGGAGLSLGRSMLRPGHLTRTESLTKEAVAALRLAGGTAPWLVGAGLVEGYASRVGLSLVPTAVIGVVAAGVFWGLVVVRGSSHNRPRRLARR